MRSSQIQARLWLVTGKIVDGLGIDVKTRRVFRPSHHSCRSAARLPTTGLLTCPVADFARETLRRLGVRSPFDKTRTAEPALAACGRSQAWGTRYAFQAPTDSHHLSCDDCRLAFLDRWLPPLAANRSGLAASSQPTAPHGRIGTGFSRLCSGTSEAGLQGGLRRWLREVAAIADAWRPGVAR